MSAWAQSVSPIGARTPAQWDNTELIRLMESGDFSPEALERIAQLLGQFGRMNETENRTRYTLSMWGDGHGDGAHPWMPQPNSEFRRSDGRCGRNAPPCPH